MNDASSEHHAARTPHEWPPWDVKQEPSCHKKKEKIEIALIENESGSCIQIQDWRGSTTIIVRFDPNQVTAPWGVKTTTILLQETKVNWNSSYRRSESALVTSSRLEGIKLPSSFVRSDPSHDFEKQRDEKLPSIVDSLDSADDHRSRHLPLPPLMIVLTTRLAIVRKRSLENDDLVGHLKENEKGITEGQDIVGEQ